jgi:SulP family sulfate permease
LSHAAGARSRASGIVTGITLLVFLPFAAVLSKLPQAVPAALVIVSILPLATVRPLIELARSSRIQVGVALTAFVLTVVLTPRIDYAIGITIVVAVLIHLWLETRVPIVVRENRTRLTLRPAGVLWFGSAFPFADAVRTNHRIQQIQPKL